MLLHRARWASREARWAPTHCVDARPENVVRACDAIQCELASDVTGLPRSLQTYVERRLRFAQDQEVEERFVATLSLCRLRSLRLGGTGQWWRMERCLHERDWQWRGCGWMCPTRGRALAYFGGLRPLEHSAAIAYPREAH